VRDVRENSASEVVYAVVDRELAKNALLRVIPTPRAGPAVFERFSRDAARFEKPRARGWCPFRTCARRGRFSWWLARRWREPR